MATGINNHVMKVVKYLDIMVVHVMQCVKMFSLGTTHQFKYVGRDVIMLLVE